MFRRRSSQCGATFFGLTPEYKRYILEELFQLQYNGKMALSDAQRLPVYQRRWFIERINKEIKAIDEEMKKASKGSKRGKR
jgi:hypothetical protein